MCLIFTQIRCYKVVLYNNGPLVCLYIHSTKHVHRYEHQNTCVINTFFKSSPLTEQRWREAAFSIQEMYL